MSRRAPNRRQGDFAEGWVADKDDLEHAPNETEWYDAVNPRTGAKHETKSTDRDDPEGGRFRVWEEQHRSLVAANASGTAWYDFVLFDGGDVVDHRRMRPATVTQLVHAQGGAWNRAGHEDREGRQHKIPASEVFGDRG